MKMKILWLFFHFAFSSVVAQEALYFSNITIDDNLSDNNITSILQDSKGFLWFGTRNGLNLYDGYEIKTYKHERDHPGSLRSSHIKSIFKDAGQNLWIGTENGVDLYDPIRDEFTHLFEERSGIKNISCFNQDQYGNIWIGTAWEGIFIYNPKSKKLQHFSGNEADKSGLNNKHITVIFKDDAQQIWVGSRTGLNLFQESSQTFKMIPPAGNTGGTELDFFITAITQDKPGNLWIGTLQNGLAKVGIDRKGFSFVNRVGDSTEEFSAKIRSLNAQKDDKIWVGTRNGLYQFSPSKNEFNQPEYTSDDMLNIPEEYSISTLEKDRAGNLWAGTTDAGVIFLDIGKPEFRTVNRRFTKNQFHFDLINAIVEREPGQYWIGTKKAGLISYNDDKGTVSSKVFQGPQNILSLHQDKSRNLWIGTYDGLYCKQANSEILSPFKALNQHFTEVKIPAQVLSIYEDKKERLWVAAVPYGLFLSDKSKQNFRMVSPIKNNPLFANTLSYYSLMEDDDGAMLVGSKNGLFIFDSLGVLKKDYKGIPFSAYNKKDISINSIIKDSANRIWLGTNKGLVYFNIKKRIFQKINIGKGLSDNEILSIIEDENQRLWVSSNHGLAKIRITEKTTDGQLLVSSENFNLADGLQNNQFRLGASCKSSDGNLLFGGINGFNIFDPNAIKINKYVPPVMITGLKVNNEEVEPFQAGKGVTPVLESGIWSAEKISLNHHHKVFSITFTALNYSSNKNNQYAYRLHGFDKKGEWNRVGNQRMATYTNLAPGEYLFEVKGSNNHQVWNEQPATLRIMILPPPWKTWWAYSGYILMISGLFFLIVRYFIQRASIRENNLKFRFFTNVSHEIRTPLTLIKSPLDWMTEHQVFDRQMVEIMQQNTETLLNLTNQLLDFRKLVNNNLKLHLSNGDLRKCIQKVGYAFSAMAYQRSITYQMKLPDGPVIGAFDSDKLEKMVYNLLSNAFKYTPDGGEILLELQRYQIDSEWVRIKVKDNGIGISQKQQSKIFNRFYRAKNRLDREGAGIGLAHTKELVKIYDGKISVESIPDQGTTFILNLPVIPQKQEAGIADFLELNKRENNKTTERIKQQELTVLIVEDNADIRAIIKREIEDSYNIVEGDNGQKGLELARKYKPDLIINDVMMDVMDGLEFCKTIKEDIRTSHIPVILLTALQSSEYKIKGLKTGADDYLTKPFNGRELRERMTNLLKQRQQLRKKFRTEMLLETKAITATSADEKFLQKLIDIVEENLANPDFTGETLVELSHCSRALLYKKLKQLTGQSVSEFIRIIRLKKAAQLLKNRTDNITQIAYAVGFKDPTYFTRCFKNFYQQSPKMYSNS